MIKTKFLSFKKVKYKTRLALAQEAHAPLKEPPNNRRLISKEVNIKTDSAAIAFFFFLLLLSFSSLFLYSLSLFFSGGIFGLIFPSAFGLFQSVKSRTFHTMYLAAGSFVFAWDAAEPHSLKLLKSSTKEQPCKRIT